MSDYKFGDVVTVPGTFATIWRFMVIREIAPDRDGTKRWIAWPVVYVPTDIHNDTVNMSEPRMLLISND